MMIEQDKLRQDYDTIRRQAQHSSHEFQTLKSNHDSTQKYVVMLEAELHHMKQKLTRLNEIAE